MAPEQLRVLVKYVMEIQDFKECVAKMVLDILNEDIKPQPAKGSTTLPINWNKDIAFKVKAKSKTLPDVMPNKSTKSHQHRFTQNETIGAASGLGMMNDRVPDEAKKKIEHWFGAMPVLKTSVSGVRAVPTSSHQWDINLLLKNNNTLAILKGLEEEPAKKIVQQVGKLVANLAGRPIVKTTVDGVLI